MPDDRLTPKELRERGFTDEEIEKIERISSEGVRFPARQVMHLVPPSDPLIAFFWARLDEAEDDAKSSGTAIEFYDGGQWRRQADTTLADVRAKKAILDDYARRCADLDNPAREMECQLIRDVIKRLATVYDGHPDYTEDFRP